MSEVMRNFNVKVTCIRWMIPAMSCNPCLEKVLDVKADISSIQEENFNLTAGLAERLGGQHERFRFILWEP